MGGKRVLSASRGALFIYGSAGAPGPELQNTVSTAVGSLGAPEGGRGARWQSGGARGGRRAPGGPGPPRGGLRPRRQSGGGSDGRGLPGGPGPPHGGLIARRWSGAGTWRSETAKRSRTVTRRSESASSGLEARCSRSPITMQSGAARGGTRLCRAVGSTAWRLECVGAV